jgi:hypothetical protein
MRSSVASIMLKYPTSCSMFRAVSAVLMVPAPQEQLIENNNNVRNVRSNDTICLRTSNGHTGTHFRHVTLVRFRH